MSTTTSAPAKRASRNPLHLRDIPRDVAEWDDETDAAGMEITDFLAARRGKSFTASEIGRALKMTTQTAGVILDVLVTDRQALRDERGAWSRYHAWDHATYRRQTA